LAQAQACPLADVLGGEEWFERFFERGTIHAEAHVGDRDQDVLAVRHRLGELRDIGFIQITIRRLDRHLAAVGHRIAGVDGQVAYL